MARLWYSSGQGCLGSVSLTCAHRQLVLSTCTAAQQPGLGTHPRSTGSWLSMQGSQPLRRVPPNPAPGHQWDQGNEELLNAPRRRNSSPPALGAKG